MHTCRTRWEVEHIAFAQQRFRTIGVENGAGVDLGRYPERNPGREVRLDQSRDYVD